VSAASSSTPRSPYAELALGLGLGVGAAAIAAVPAAIRTSGAGVSLVVAWLSLWGSAALMLAPAVGALRVARPLPPGALAVPAALLISAPLLIVLARILKTTTHHRPLGAATFAMLAAAVVLGAIAVAARLIGSARRAGRWQRIARASLTLLLALSALATFALALPLVRAGSGSVIDALLALGLAAGAVWARVPPAFERAARFGGPAVLIVAVGAGFAARSSGVREATRTNAPVLAGPFR
jgi:hypothetical protein